MVPDTETSIGVIFCITFKILNKPFVAQG